MKGGLKAVCGKDGLMVDNYVCYGNSNDFDVGVYSVDVRADFQVKIMLMKSLANLLLD